MISSTTSRRERLLYPDRNTMWDPSGPDVQNIKIHHDIYSLLTVADINVAEMDAVDDDLDEVGGSRTELDSHANMPVVGRHAYIISKTGKTADVSPFTPDYKSMKYQSSTQLSNMRTLTMERNTF